MSNYPSIEEYSNALQAARNTIQDPKIAAGTVQTNNWGIPLARNGTFALTYKITAGGRDYAFRCFQRDRPGMHKRYTAISAALRKNSLPYFVTFDYLDTGITILTKSYPALVMQWAEGEPLGSYIEQNKSRPTKLKALRTQVEALGQSLEAAGIAHGDIQTNNIVVTDDGELRLVDYDGMFVPAIASMGALEAGHKNFQHPEREKLSPYDASLDRFSLAVLHVGISALIEKPSMWNKLSGDPEALLMRASDFADPDNSEAFQMLAALPGAGEGAQRLIAISKAPYAEVPSFGDFLAGKNIPTSSRTITSKPKKPKTASGGNAAGTQIPWYHEAAGTGTTQAPAAPPRYRVLDASDLGACLGAAGQEVELIGQIKNITFGGHENGLPFAHLRLAVDIDTSPEVLIWFQGMRALDFAGRQPSAAWKGQWVSATGIMSSRGDANTATHPAIVIETANQFELLTPSQAKLRLAGGAATAQATAPPAPQTNAEKLAGLGGAGKQKAASSGTGGTGGMASPPQTPGGLDRTAVLWILGLVALIIGIVVAIAIASSQNSYGSETYSDDSGLSTTVSASDQVGTCWNQYMDELPCESTDAKYVAASWEVMSSNCPELYFPADDGNYLCLTQDLARPTVTLASDQVGSCWDSQFSEVDCGSATSSYKATTWLSSSYGCIDEALEWEDGNYLCLSETEPALNPADYETCFTEEINGRSCATGLAWTYSACWVYPDAVLEQKIAGEWNSVMTNFTTKDLDACEAEFPYLVEFTRKAAGPGTKSYNLYFPASGKWPSGNSPIKVTVTKQ